MRNLIPGINDASLHIILSTLSECQVVSQAILFGSRAKGNYKQGSDIDLAIKGQGIDKDVLSSLNAAFEESSLIYFVDIISYEHIANPDLKSHIDRVGTVIFNR